MPWVACLVILALAALALAEFDAALPVIMVRLDINGPVY